MVRRWFAASWLVGCGARRRHPSLPPARCCSPGRADDPADWDAQVDPSVDWTPVLSEPTWVVPSDAVPDGITVLPSNNNVSILLTDDRLFLAWRTSHNHFASVDTEMHVVSSDDGGASWVHEHTVALGTDVREPTLLLADGHVVLTFFQAGTEPLAFEPQAVWRSERCATGDWTDEIVEDDTTRVPWDLKERGGVLYRTSYTGEHYGEGVLDLHFERSDDGGRTFSPVGDDPVYQGGNSEAAFEIAQDGRLWAVTRNEDGDATGQGAMVCTAEPDQLGVWDCPDVSDPERYDSPELLRHGDDLYLIARRDLGGPFGDDEGMLPYSTRPKRTALYRIDPEARAVVWLFDLPSAGDTAFPQARRTGPHTFLVANYSSPLEMADASWLQGQTDARGTGVWLATLTFE
ncbi:MAG: sialidase family protein [Myxococcota bacterium]